MLGTKDPANHLRELAKYCGASTALSDLGMRQEDVRSVADQVLTASYSNPRKITKDDLVGLPRRVVTGTTARSHPGRSGEG
jgi:alcohol dehydrogenase class IV